LTEFQTKVPEPLSQDLKAFLSPGSARDPTIGILLLIFIREDGFKGAAMQIQIEHVFGTECRSRQGRDEQFVDHPRPPLTHRGSVSGGGTGSHQQADSWSRRRKRNVRTIKEYAGHLAFRMGAGRGRRPGQDGLHRRKIKQRVVLVARTHSHLRRQHIEKRSSIAVEAIETHQETRMWDLHLFGILGEDGEHPQPFAPVIAIASPAKGSWKLPAKRCADSAACAGAAPRVWRAAPACAWTTTAEVGAGNLRQRVVE
jgi:hypothetical protein